MVIKNTLLGGTDWAAETVAFEDLNDTFDAVIDKGNVGIAQLAYKHLKDDGSFTNEDYLAADLFTDADGVNNTVVTGTTTALYSASSDNYTLNVGTDLASSGTDHYGTDGSGGGSWSNVSNAFDSDDDTYATATGYAQGVTRWLGKTFSSTAIGAARYKVYTSVAPSGYSNPIYLQTYNGSVWTTVSTVGINTGGSTTFSGSVTIDDTIQGVRLFFSHNTGSNTGTTTDRVYTLEYGAFDATDVVTTESVLTLIGDEKFITVYGKKDLPSGTTITMDISDGTTTLTTQPLDQSVSIATLSAGDLDITFNLETALTANTPALYGYGVVLTK